MNFAVSFGAEESNRVMGISKCEKSYKNNPILTVVFSLLCWSVIDISVFYFECEKRPSVSHLALNYDKISYLSLCIRRYTAERNRQEEMGRPENAGEVRYC